MLDSQSSQLLQQKLKFQQSKFISRTLFQIRLIQNYQQILPFGINQINNLIQLSYTCFVDLQDAKKYLEIQVIGGYRRLKINMKRNRKYQSRNEYGNNNNGGYQYKEMTREEGVKQQENKGNKQEKLALDNKDQNQLLQQQQIKRYMTKKQDIQVVVLIIAVEGLNQKRMEKQKQSIDLRQEKQTQFKSNNKNKNLVKQNQNIPLLYVPYNIYKQLSKSLRSCNLYPHTPLFATIRRFPISLTQNLRITSSHQTLEKIRIKNLIPPFLGNDNIANVKLINQWKDLIVRILINPRYHLERRRLLSNKSKENQRSGKDQESAILGEYEFYVFLCGDKQNNRDNINNIPRQKPNKKSINYQLDLSLLAQKNNEQTSSLIKANFKTQPNSSTSTSTSSKYQSLKTQQHLLQLIKQNNQQINHENQSLQLTNIIKNYIQFEVQFQVGIGYGRYCEEVNRMRSSRQNETGDQQNEQQDYHSPYILKFLPGKTLIEFQQQNGIKQNQNKQISNGNQRIKGSFSSRSMLDKKSLFVNRIVISELYKEIFLIKQGVYQWIFGKFETMMMGNWRKQGENIVQCLQNKQLKLRKHQNHPNLFYLQSDSFICLKTDNQIGIQTYFHYLSQQHFNRKFLLIDCQSFVTRKQLFRYLKNITAIQGENVLLLIKNIGWLQNLSKIEDISPQPIKSILENVYNAIREAYRGTLVKFITIVYFAQDALPQELPHVTSRWEVYLRKQTKLEILKMIFQQISKTKKIVINPSIQQTITNMLINSYGWERILQFLKQLTSGQNQKENIFNRPEKQIIKLIQKQFSLQNIQNVAEVSWDDIGGLETAKQQIIQTVLLPTKHPQIFDEWIRPRTGLLFYGPPGTGKTLLGKCIAKQCKMSFISVKGPELLNMYVGESEKNVRQIFQRAKQSKPCIVFMDQLDALVPKRGNSSDSNAVMDRIVAQLLTQMDTASENGIFIIGATNRPDLLDPSILRTGRFDKQIYLGISKNHEDRVKILKAQTRNSKLNSYFNYDQIIKKVPINFTGADFYGLTSKAMMKAVQRCISLYQKGEQTNPQVIITQNDFQQVIPSIKPSVSQQQLKHYQSLKQKFS